MSRLHEISGTANPDRVGDVVFVHGLDGDAIATWQSKQQADSFWPKWLGEDLPQVGIWSLDYEAHSIAWKGSAMPLSDRATNVLALLEAHGVGRKPLVFIAHSLGGLLVKQLLRHALDYGQPEWKVIADNARGIVFLATPHSGSNIASWLQYASLILRNNVTIEDLRAHDAHLRNLNLWFRNSATKLDLKCQVYFEKLKVAKLLVVDETSADPGIQGVIPVPVDSNHIDICKIIHKTDVVFVRTRRFVETCIAAEVAKAKSSNEDPSTHSLKSSCLRRREMFHLGCGVGVLALGDGPKRRDDIAAFIGVAEVTGLGHERPFREIKEVAERIHVGKTLDLSEMEQLKSRYHSAFGEIENLLRLRQIPADVLSTYHIGRLLYLLPSLAAANHPALAAMADLFEAHLEQAQLPPSMERRLREYADHARRGESQALVSLANLLSQNLVNVL